MRNKRKNIKGLSGFLCLLCMLTSINVYAEETEENVKDNNRTYYSGICRRKLYFFKKCWR